MTLSKVGDSFVSLFAFKYRSFRCATLASVILLAGCAPVPASFYVAPEYRNLRVSEASMVVLPYLGKLLTQEQFELFIQRKMKEKKLVTGLEVELFESYFPTLLAEKTYAKVLRYDYKALSAGIDLRFNERESSVEPKMNLFVPASGRIQIGGEIPEYLLIVQDLFFMRGKSEGETGQIPGGGKSVEYSLEMGLDYMLWDNRNEKTVAYGRLKRKAHLFAPPSKDVYLSCMDEFAGSVIKNSPLSERMISF